MRETGEGMRGVRGGRGKRISEEGMMVGERKKE